MLNKNAIKWILIGIFTIGVWFLGFYLGRKKVKTIVKTKVEYLRTEVHDTILKPVPVKEYPPIDTLAIIQTCIRDGIYAELFPEREVEVIKYVPMESDSTAIMKDWATLREYCDTLIKSDTTGTFVLSTSIQYNRVKQYTYEYENVTKVIREKIYYTPSFSPFIGAGMLFNGTGIVHGGFYIKEKYGISAIYQRDFPAKTNAYGAIFSYKF